MPILRIGRASEARPYGWGLKTHFLLDLTEGADGVIDVLPGVAASLLKPVFAELETGNVQVMK